MCLGRPQSLSALHSSTSPRNAWFCCWWRPRWWRGSSRRRFASWKTGRTSCDKSLPFPPRRCTVGVYKYNTLWSMCLCKQWLCKKMKMKHTQPRTIGCFFGYTTKLLQPKNSNKILRRFIWNDGMFWLPFHRTRSNRRAPKFWALQSLAQFPLIWYFGRCEFFPNLEDLSWWWQVLEAGKISLEVEWGPRRIQLCFFELVTAVVEEVAEKLLWKEMISIFINP